MMCLAAISVSNVEISNALYVVDFYSKSFQAQIKVLEIEMDVPLQRSRGNSSNNSFNMQKGGKAKVKYNGKTYVVRIETRVRKYILVQKKKVYIVTRLHSKYILLLMLIV